MSVVWAGRKPFFMTEHDAGYKAGWENASREAIFHCCAALGRLEPNKDKKLREALERLEALMRSNLLARRGIRE